MLKTAFPNTNAISFYTNARAATDLSAVFYDSSSIQISFTMPNNSYSSSYYYLLRASESGVNTDISGTTSPLFVKGLSGGTTYSCYILSYLDNALGATSSSYRVTTTSAGIFYTGITAIPIYTSAGTVSTFSSDTKTVSGATGSYAYANGSYVCLASSGGEGTYCYMGANGSTSSYCCYGTQGSSYGSNYSQDPYVGTYQGGGSGRYWTTTVSSVSYAGEWIQYKLPYKLKLTSYGIMNRNNSGTNRFPYTFYLAGSNNGSTWELVDSRSNQTVSDYGLYTYTVSSTSYYYYFRLIFNVQNSGVNVVNINQFNLYGTALV
jgi:hypothetical protein